VALAAGAHGVQLRYDSLSPEDARRLNREWWIGVSVHDLAEARAAHAAGADYLLLGPVFRRPPHPGRASLGCGPLADVVTLGLPVIGDGGVTAERIGALRVAGAYGVAAIRALWEAADPGGAAAAMIEELTAR